MMYRFVQLVPDSLGAQKTTHSRFVLVGSDVSTMTIPVLDKFLRMSPSLLDVSLSLSFSLNVCARVCVCTICPPSSENHN